MYRRTFATLGRMDSRSTTLWYTSESHGVVGVIFDDVHRGTVSRITRKLSDLPVPYSGCTSTMSSAPAIDLDSGVVFRASPIGRAFGAPDDGNTPRVKLSCCAGCDGECQALSSLTPLELASRTIQPPGEPQTNWILLGDCLNRTWVRRGTDPAPSLSTTHESMCGYGVTVTDRITSSSGDLLHPGVERVQILAGAFQ